MIKFVAIWLVAFAAPCAALWADGLGRAAAAAATAQPRARDESNPLPPIVLIPGLTSSNISYTLYDAPNIVPGCPSTVSTPTPMWPTDQVRFNTSRDLVCWFENLATIYNPLNQQFGPRLVEHAYNQSGGRKVTLISVSWGPQATLAFLHRMTQSWKDKYLSMFIAESPLWSGSPLSLLTMTSGYEAPGVPNARLFMREVATLVHVIMDIFPRAGTSNTTFTREEVIIETPTRNYTAFDAEALLEDLGYGYKLPALRNIQNNSDLGELLDPGVDTFIQYGYDIPTPGMNILQRREERDALFLEARCGVATG
ncbi:uncharacterized protein MONBRDRAFT_9050 [Monosiga brevicollis MX1]|uniref:GPI inositol-deacylase n=1 Tax=Monosiga brevicollis TaxID=81824 RepID=A9V1X9_MONBE|nr:uncharacterized protein MONBRDRAFT_9050 [Monosiga brevicollis MX1]EDQ88642.1 predicted protein [Monosiga brevicollis MX1]|eukprot:XP_001746746.1 hypothetical protein [Monosiga brevicollis MX1]